MSKEEELYDKISAALHGYENKSIIKATGNILARAVGISARSPAAVDRIFDAMIPYMKLTAHLVYEEYEHDDEPGPDKTSVN
jgi:hypothetical protein